jgi:SulP family sulfate permease
MTWLPKFVVCFSYYDRFRFRSDAFAALFLALQIFPLAIAIAVATGVPPLYGVFCAAIAGLLASVFGDSKIAVGMLIGMFLYIRKKPAILTKAAPGTSHNP